MKPVTRTAESVGLDDERMPADASVVFRALHVDAAVFYTGTRAVHSRPASLERVLLIAFRTGAMSDVTSCAGHVIAAFRSRTVHADALA